ncbi:hypothetical protein Y032_0122g1048 [Ancylostoma ceylanicum]|uniref:Uncharacterized protein n=1 Tax=Ancylostoma ceylanicum TaxID=53326 RepID=A0A016T9T5_9BILA|nr:hypothetical protein Y032_0122g1048 [Ancylostoma ceylanicum]
MASVIGYPVDYVTLRDAGRKSRSATLVSLGFAFINPSPEPHTPIGPSNGIGRLNRAENCNCKELKKVFYHKQEY